MPLNYSLGPISYCWEKSAVIAFYQQVAKTDIPLVYLGETVCSRRRELTFKDYLDIAHQLKASGKQIVLSTLALIQAKSELTELKKIINNGEFIIEANDMAGVQLAREQKLPFVCGPEINNYNLQSLKLLHQCGMQRFVMPIELSRNWLAAILEQKHDLGFEAEVLGYGHLPLAHSARCFTARHHKVCKDKCDTRCKTYPTGIAMHTMEQQPLLRLNGIQTQSFACMDLQDFRTDMQQLGVDWYRISPFDIESIKYAQNLIDGQSASVPAPSCNGYWLGQAGLDRCTI